MKLNKIKYGFLSHLTTMNTTAMISAKPPMPMIRPVTSPSCRDGVTLTGFALVWFGNKLHSDATNVAMANRHDVTSTMRVVMTTGRYLYTPQSVTYEQETSLLQRACALASHKSPGFYPWFHARWCKQESGSRTRIYPWLTCLLTYLLAWMLLCCVYVVRSKFWHLLFFREKPRKLLMASVKC